MLTMFDIGETVKVKSNGKIGRIKSYKYEKFKDKKSESLEESSRYFIMFNSFSFEWVDETDLEACYKYEFSDEFNFELFNLLIDVYLLSGNYDLVKKMNDLKSKYRK